MLALLEALLPLLLTLTQVLADLLRWRVLDKVTLLVKTSPLGQTVGDVDAALAVEHVESSNTRVSITKHDKQTNDAFCRTKNVPRSKIPLLLITLELDQRREQQNHVPALVHDRTVAEGTADLAGQLVLGGFGGRVVPLEVVVAVFEVDVVFVEDGGPLERCSWKRELAFSISSMAVIFFCSSRGHTMLGLASGAVAQFAVQRLLSANLILDFAAVASRLVAGFEVLVGVVEAVRGLCLPVVEAGRVLLRLLFGAHLGGVCAGCCGGSFVRTVGGHWS